MPSFSIRNGYAQNRDIRELDEGLRNVLWSGLSECYSFFSKKKTYHKDPIFGTHAECLKLIEKDIGNSLWLLFLENRSDDLDNAGSLYESLSKFFRTCEWYKIFDLIEFLLKYDRKRCKEVTIKINDLMKKKSMGYQIVDDKFIPVTSELELDEIKTAIQSNSPWSKHIEKALADLSERNKTDYEVTVASAIKAAETAAATILRKTSGSLSELITEMVSTGLIEENLGKAYKDVYAYANKHSRHINLKSGIPIDIGLATLVLVNCVSLCNYIDSQNMQDKAK